MYGEYSMADGISNTSIVNTSNLHHARKGSTYVHTKEAEQYEQKKQC
jgi:hypothetical protein